jgi:hypothetical protein
MHKTDFPVLCRKCSFWVTKEVYCPNCGIIKPTLQEIETSNLTDVTHVYFSSAIIVLIKIMAFLAGSLPIALIVFLIPVRSPVASIIKLSGMVMLSFMTGVGFVFLASFILKKLALANEKRSETSFMNSEALIRNRLQAVNLETERAVSLLDKYKESNTKDANLRSQLLQNALETWTVQRDKYFLKMSEIKVFRWLNELKPYISGINAQNFQQLDSHINCIKNIMNKGEVLKEELPESAKNRVDNTLATCFQLIEDLENQRVALMAKSASALNSATMESDSSRRLENEHNLLNALTNITQFNSGMDELEKEFYRLKGEKEVESWGT